MPITAVQRRQKHLPLSLLWLLLPLVLLIPGLNAFPYPSPEARFSDLTITHYPNTLYLRQALATGDMPLWSDQILSGMPFGANPLAGVWYPPGWLALVLPLPFAFNLLVALHLLWGGLGMYGLLRAEGLASPAALFGALGFAFLPKLFAHYGAGHLTLLYAVPWTPWLLWAARYQFSGRHRVGFYPWQALVLALILLADVRWAAFAAALWVGYSLAHTQWRSWPRQLFGLAVQFLLAVLLAAPLLIPLLELAGLSSRSAMTAQDALVFSLPPLSLLGLLYPDMGGYHEYTLYVGQVVLALSLLLAIRAVPHPAGRFWIWAAFLATLLALGAYLPPLALLARLPGLDLLRAPARWLFVAGLAFAAAAACGVDALLATPNSYHRRRADLALTALAGFSLAMTASLWVLRGQIALNFLWGAAFILASAAWIGLRLAGRLPAGVWLAGLFVLGLLDWAGVDRTLFAARSAESVLAEGRLAAEYLATQTGMFRVYSPSYSLPQQTSAQAGLQLADGVDPLQLTAYVDFMQEATGVPSTGYSVTLPPFAGDGDPATANAAYRPDPELLGLLNVRYIGAEFDLPVDGLLLETQFGSTRVYRNLLARPRAWLEPASASIQQPAIIEWRPDRIEIQAQGPGLLVLSEIAYPGWKVEVDGTARSVETYDGLLRAVSLSSGEHRVVFTFRPASLNWGLAGFAIAALCLVGAAWLGQNASRRQRTQEEEV
jgi:hypothetical protein